MRITYNNYRYILNLKKKPIFIQKLLRYDLLVMDGTASVKCSIPLWLYVVLFIPAHLITVVMLLWDGGLKEFELAPRTCSTWHFHKGDTPYERAKEIYKKS